MQPIHNDKSSYAYAEQVLKNTAKAIVSDAVRKVIQEGEINASGVNIRAIGTRYYIPQNHDQTIKEMPNDKQKIITKLFYLTHNDELIKKVPSHDVLDLLETPSQVNKELTIKDALLTRIIMDYVDEVYQEITVNSPSAFQNEELWK